MENNSLQTISGIFESVRNMPIIEIKKFIGELDECVELRDREFELDALYDRECCRLLGISYTHAGENETDIQKLRITGYLLRQGKQVSC